MHEALAKRSIGMDFVGLYLQFPPDVIRELVEHSIIPISVRADILELNSVVCSRSQVQLTFEY